MGFLADVLERHAGLVPLGGNLSPMVEVTLFERPGGELLLHLVNASGHFGEREVSPVPMRDVEVVLPLGGEPSEVRALVGGSCTWNAMGERLSISVAELGLFEALTIVGVAS